MKFQIIFFVASIISCTLIGQNDTIRLQSVLSTEVRGKHILSAIQKNQSCIHCVQENIVDNPFNHSAVYAIVSHELIVNSKYTFETGIVLEQRSFSHGNNNTRNNIVFPKIKMLANDTFNLIRRNFLFKIKAGDFWDEDINDIIRFHNIDYHGLELGIGLNNYWLKLNSIADLSFNIGLALPEVHKFSLERKTDHHIYSISASLNSLRIRTNGHPTSSDVNIDFYTKHKVGVHSEVLFQLSLRNNREINTGLATGFILTRSNKQFLFEAGIRFYSATYNQGFYSPFLRYGSENIFTGQILYPLKNYFRPFHQWAAITQFQGRNIFNISLDYRNAWRIYKKIHCFIDLDINSLLFLPENDLRIFPFYDVGWQINFSRQIKTKISITNKHQNQVQFFQGFSASHYPFFSYAFSFDLNSLPLGSKKFRPK